MGYMNIRQEKNVIGGLKDRYHVYFEIPNYNGYFEVATFVAVYSWNSNLHKGDNDCYWRPIDSNNLGRKMNIIIIVVLCKIYAMFL